MDYESSSGCLLAGVGSRQHGLLLDECRHTSLPPPPFFFLNLNSTDKALKIQASSVLLPAGLHNTRSHDGELAHCLWHS